MSYNEIVSGLKAFVAKESRGLSHTPPRFASVDLRLCFRFSLVGRGFAAIDASTDTIQVAKGKNIDTEANIRCHSPITCVPLCYRFVWAGRRCSSKASGGCCDRLITAENIHKMTIEASIL